MHFRTTLARHILKCIPEAAAKLLSTGTLLQALVWLLVLKF
jgi:hypothetical protein